MQPMLPVDPAGFRTQGRSSLAGGWHPVDGNCDHQDMPHPRRRDLMRTVRSRDIFSTPRHLPPRGLTTPRAFFGPRRPPQLGLSASGRAAACFVLVGLRNCPRLLSTSEGRSVCSTVAPLLDESCRRCPRRSSCRRWRSDCADGSPSQDEEQQADQHAPERAMARANQAVEVLHFAFVGWRTTMAASASG